MFTRRCQRMFPVAAVATVLLCWSAAVAAMSFSDIFDDGMLDGWIPKQGQWSNPGGYLLSSFDNYGVAWREGSFGLDQRLEVDAYFDGQSSNGSKTALLGLRGGEAGNLNPYFDHAYWAYVLQDKVLIVSTYAPYDSQNLAAITGLDLPRDSWISIAFQVTGTGSDTRLQLWVNSTLMLDVPDLSGRPHNDGGYVALGASNHINRYIAYDNANGRSDGATPPVPEPETWLMLALGLGALVVKLHRTRKPRRALATAS